MLAMLKKFTIMLINFNNYCMLLIIMLGYYGDNHKPKYG